MRSMVLGAFGGKLDQAPLKINLRPHQIGNLRLALASQDQQSDDASVIVVTTCTPHFDKLRFGQDSISGLVRSSWTDVESRIDLTVSALYGPSKKATQCRASTISSELTLSHSNVVHYVHNCLARDGFHSLRVNALPVSF